jgi:hypothetical protein
MADVEAKGRKAVRGSKKAILNHTNLRSDFALNHQCQSQQDWRLQSSYGLAL